MGNSLGWWATTVATYCPSRPSQLAQKNMTKHGERVDEKRCRKVSCTTRSVPCAIFRPSANTALITLKSNLRASVKWLFSAIISILTAVGRDGVGLGAKK